MNTLPTTDRARNGHQCPSWCDPEQCDVDRTGGILHAIYHMASRRVSLGSQQGSVWSEVTVDVASDLAVPSGAVDLDGSVSLSIDEARDLACTLWLAARDAAAGVQELTSGADR